MNPGEERVYDYNKISGFDHHYFVHSSVSDVKYKCSDFVVMDDFVEWLVERGASS